MPKKTKKRGRPKGSKDTTPRKKKVEKKPIQKKTKPKTTTRLYKKKIVPIEEVYVLLNSAQVDHKLVKFSVTFDDSPVVENIIVDIKCQYTKIVTDDRVMYHIDHIDVEDPIYQLDEIDDAFFDDKLIL